VSTAGSGPRDVAYHRPIAFVRGQELRFPDFALRFDRLVSASMGSFGGHERFRTDYVFELRGHGGTDAEREVIWSHGYPGGLAPVRLTLGRRQHFDGEIRDVSEAGGTITVSPVPPDAEHGVPVDFVRGRWLEYPAFDVTLSDIRSRPWSAAEKAAYLEGVRAYYRTQGLAAPEDLESFYGACFAALTELELVIRAGADEQRLIVSTTQAAAAFRVLGAGYELRILEQILGGNALVGVKATISEAR